MLAQMLVQGENGTIMPQIRHATQTPEQLILRDDAAASNPEFATPEGRAMQDVRDTLAYLALGMKPRTVLGGLITNLYGPYSSVLVDAEGRHAVEIGFRGNVDPFDPNERGDTVQDVLEGLVQLGLVERTFDPGSVAAELASDDDRRKRMDIPFYRLSTQNLPTPVQERIDTIRSEMVALEERATERMPRQQRTTVRKPNRTGIFRRKR